MESVFVGDEDDFGDSKNEGFEEYWEYGKEFGMGVMECKGLREDGVCVSCRLIGCWLCEGKIELVNCYVGYDYYLRGRVVEGGKVGGSLGLGRGNIEGLWGDKVLGG